MQDAVAGQWVCAYLCIHVCVCVCLGVHFVWIVCWHLQLCLDIMRIHRSL